VDFFYWGGPVYCKTAKDLKWLRPTKVMCNPQEGASNSSYFYSLGKDPLEKLLRKSGLSADKVRSIGFGGFSAFHQFLNPMLKIPEVCKRVDYVHLADACFQGVGATKPHGGYVAFAKRAANGDARMTITTNGPWGKDISYMGPSGSKYEGRQFNLISGAKCIEMVWQAAVGRLIESDADVPPGVPRPQKIFREGQLFWFHYESGLKDPHGGHTNQLAQPYMQMYGVPWMGSDRNVLADCGTAAVFAALGYLGVKSFLEK
jgi:hypothetical protein